MKSSTARKIFIVVFFAVGIGLIIGAVFSYKYLTEKYEKCSEKTFGTVKSIVSKVRESKDSDGRTSKTTYYYPVIDFTVNDEVYTKKSNVGNGNKPNYEVSDKIEIAYDPSDPNSFYIVDDNGFFIVYVLGGMGIIFTLIPIFGIIILMKEKH